MSEDISTKEIEEGLTEALKMIQKNLKLSFKLIQANPDKEKQIISLWKNYIDKLVKKVTIMSEKYNNNKIIKALTKSFLFG